MNNSKKGKSALISRKMIISFLLIVSVLLTSSTFAYWADVVVGAQREVTSTFVVGSPMWDDQEFVLNSSVDYIRYDIDLEYLLEDPTVNVDEIVFGITWDDLELSDELKEKISTGEITINYELEMYKNGNLLNTNTYRRYSTLIDITLDDENPNEVKYMDFPSTFRLDISLTEENRNNDYKNLGKMEAVLVISFEVNDFDVDGDEDLDNDMILDNDNDNDEFENDYNDYEDNNNDIDDDNDEDDDYYDWWYWWY